MVIKCNHILISLYKLKPEAEVAMEIACKFQYADFKGSIPYCIISTRDARGRSYQRGRLVGPD